MLPVKILFCLYILFLLENRLIQQKEFSEWKLVTQSLQFWFETFDFQISGNDKKLIIKSKVSAVCNFPTDLI